VILDLAPNELELVLRALSDYVSDTREQAARVVVRLADPEEGHEMARFFRQECAAAAILRDAIQSGGRAVAALGTREAFKAAEHAGEIVKGCESVDELDEASNYEGALANCPADFTQEQKELAQAIILRAFERAIGRT
jgi:D-alanine-D-alanine ligase-like ATP-grasp enzyme